MRRLTLLLPVILWGCTAIRQPGTTFEVVHTESSSKGMAYITSLGI